MSHRHNGATHVSDRGTRFMGQQWVSRLFSVTILIALSACSQTGNQASNQAAPLFTRARLAFIAAGTVFGAAFAPFWFGKQAYTMSKIYKLTVTLMLTVLCTMPPLVAQETVSNPDLVMDLKWEIGSWSDIWRIGQFESAAVTADVSYYIYLPPGYEQGSKRYPVVYWFHGAYGRPHSATPIVRRLDAAIRAGNATEMIVVSSIDPTGLSMWTNSKDGRLPMETITIEELIPHIDSTYRTLAERRGRAIEGFSMGGYGAAYLGVKYHSMFSSISVLAGALHTPETFRERRRAIYDNVFSADAEYAREKSPWTNLERNADAVRGRTDLRVHVGADDGLLDWNRNYHLLLDELDIEHEWSVVPDSPHDLEVLMQNWEGDFFAYYQGVFGGN